MSNKPPINPLAQTMGYDNAPPPVAQKPAKVLDSLRQTVGYDQDAPPSIAPSSSPVSAPRVVPVVSPPMTPASAVLPEVLRTRNENEENHGHSPFDATLAADSEPSKLSTASPTQTLSGRVTTVLPSVEEDDHGLRLIPRNKERYASVKQLGVGGMGEVDLALDEDIGRRVAVKRMYTESLSPAAIARFVDEVHIVGQLEHPNIVPIHDVGLDSSGRFFLVMKYLEGETLEGVIDKLREGNAEYLAKYSVEYRVEVFMGVLRALQYAHANGIVHRDIKPANVMVGRYGEVVLMDWGIAKSTKKAGERGGDTDEKDITESPRGRAFTTRHGALIGTPAYMAPEQARGLNDQIDERTDLFAAVVLLHELLSLRHYLYDKTTVAAMIAGVLDGASAVTTHGWYQGAQLPPAEYLHLFAKGLQSDPNLRFQNATELVNYLQDILTGKIHVQCPVTMTKRMTREAGRFVDRNPWLGFSMFVGGTALFVSSLAVSVLAILR
ncbi:MAG: serine/threonine-protein kinase [Deltaproteobacteria bacterium]|nr:serine/threonine-protein kinase [Deltaproteobacteria bacterium]